MHFNLLQFSIPILYVIDKSENSYIISTYNGRKQSISFDSPEDVQAGSNI